MCTGTSRARSRAVRATLTEPAHLASQVAVQPAGGDANTVLQTRRSLHRPSGRSLTTSGKERSGSADPYKKTRCPGDCSVSCGTTVDPFASVICQLEGGQELVCVSRPLRLHFLPPTNPLSSACGLDRAGATAMASWECATACGASRAPPARRRVQLPPPPGVTPPTSLAASDRSERPAHAPASSDRTARRIPLRRANGART